MFFRDLKIDKQEISYFLCRTHLEQTLKRKLINFRCKKSYKHLYATLYYRKIDFDCENSIKQAINTTFNKKKQDYIERK